MRWFFEPRRDDDGAGQDEDGSAPGLISLPAALLHRHGARVLDPGTAVAVRGYPAPRSTVYRTRTLLVPDDLLRDQAFIAAVNRVLERTGMQLIPPRPNQDRANGDAGVALAHPAVLVPAQDSALPVEVDAWRALQTLRAAARAGLDPTAVQRIGLEHLLIGSAIFGAPASGGAGGLTGSSGPTSTDSYQYSGGDTRTPVAVLLDAPARKPAAECATEYGRRAVLAVLDTGLRAHWWLDVKPEPGGGYDTEPDGFAAVDYGIQQAIYAAGQAAVAAGDQRQLIRHPWDAPVTADPLVGELDDATGHGTFIAGIARQVVPDAQVLVLRVMHSDGIVYESDLICALGQLATRIAQAEAGAMTAMVDVISLSFGYFSESASDVAFSSALWQAIQALLGMGVVVVAAAGNYSTSRMFYPAAFARQPVPAGQVPVISVGALNPNGSKAMFSNGGRWITAWAAGAAVVSTFPADVNGSRTPELRMRAHPGNQLPPDVALPAEREALDPDDYRDGFAVWSGTSFSAPLLAAQIVGSLLDGATGTGPGLRLDLTGEQAAADRALAALQNLGWQG